MKKLVVIDACVRQGESRTRRIGDRIVEAIKARYSEIHRYNLAETYAQRSNGIIPEWAAEAAGRIAAADAIVIMAPFWDMSFPAVLKCFLEQVSLFGITFDDNGETCVGLCKKAPVLYITTRGMDIRTGSAREQATPYLKALASLWGLGKVTTIAAANMDYSSPEEIEVKIKTAIKKGLKVLL